MRTIFIVIIACLLSGCADMRPVQSVKHESDLVMAVASSPGNVGLIGIASGRATNETTRTAALNELVARHPEWHWQQIRAGEMGVGMTDAEVLLSWGQPYRVNRASYGAQWVYCRGLRNCIPARYVYFDTSGICTAWN